MKLEESIRAHIDGAARPITLDEIQQRADSLSSSGLQTIAILDPDSITTVEDLDPTSARASGHGVVQAETVEINHGIRPVRWLQAAAILLAVGLSATAVLRIRDSRSVGFDTAGTTETQAAAALATMEEAASATVDGWTEVDDPGGVFVAPDITDLVEVSRLDRFNLPWGLSPSIFQVVDIKHLSSGYYAVGSHNDEVISSAAIWHSDDAETWEQVLGSEQSYKDWEIDNSYPAGTGLEDIAEHKGTIVAVGWIRSERSAPAVWVQTAVGGWEVIRLPDTEGTGHSEFSIVAGTNGFTVSGTVFDEEWEEFHPLIWRSADGVNWESVGSSAFETGDQFYDLATVGDTLVAVGRSGGWDNPSAAAWFSSDGGLTWTRSGLQDGPKSLRYSSVFSMAAGPDGLLAIGGRSSGDAGWTWPGDDESATLSGSSVVAIWTSADGQTWTEHPGPTDSIGQENPFNVEWGPAGFLITSGTATANGYHASSWLTVDGTELSRVGDQEAVGAAMFNLAATPDRYLSLADPEFHFFDYHDDEYHGPTDKDPHHLEIWKLEVS